MKKNTGKQGPPPKDPNEGLPANEDAERLVLGSILKDADTHLAAVRAELQPMDLILEKHRRIYRRALDLDERGVKVDRVTVAEELKRNRELASCDGLSYLVSLDDGLPEIPHVAAYVAIIREKSLRRKIIFAADAFSKRAFLETENVDEVIAAGADTFQKLAAGRNHREEAPSVPVWPEPIREEGFYGIGGQIVRAIEPHTESDRAALLVQFLIGWGSLIGRGPYYLAEGDRHYANEFGVIVGTTSKGRKGTSWGRICGVLGTVDGYWAENRLLFGLGSGEALIDAVGEEDRRTLVMESEFARLLSVISRDGSTVSANIRNAWDTGILEIRTRQNKVKVTGAHLSLIGHVTREELLRRLDSTETANGFINRILLVCARRSQLLPMGGASFTLNAGILGALKEATDQARRMGNTRMQFDQDAETLWRAVYEELSEGKPGLLGAATSRAEAHVVRLSLIYALLDSAAAIRIEHLRAALAVWNYCAASARFIWGDAIGDPTADETLRALRAASEDGLSRWDLMNHFSRHKSAEELDRAIGVLAERGLVRTATEDTGGRPVVRYWAL